MKKREFRLRAIPQNIRPWIRADLLTFDSDDDDERDIWLQHPPKLRWTAGAAKNKASSSILGKKRVLSPLGNSLRMYWSSALSTIAVRQKKDALLAQYYSVKNNFHPYHINRFRSYCPVTGYCNSTLRDYGFARHRFRKLAWSGIFKGLLKFK